MLRSSGPLHAPQTLAQKPRFSAEPEGTATIRASLALAWTTTACTLHSSLSLSLSLRPPHPPTHTLGLASRPQHPLLTSAPGVPGLPGAPGFPGSPGGPWQGGGEEGGENGAKLSLIGCSVVCRPHWMEGRKEVESQSADVLTGGPGGPFGPRSPWKARGKAGQWVSGGCWGPSGTGTGQVVRSCDQPPGATGRRTASLRSPQASRPHSQPSSTSHPASG